MKTDAEVQVMLLQTKQRLELPNAGRNEEGSFPYGFQREQDPADNLTLDFWPPELWENRLPMC